MTFKETRKRSLVKTVVWRIVATLGTWLLLYVYLGEAIESLEITVVAALISMVAHYLYERLWDVIQWGRNAA